MHRGSRYGDRDIELSIVSKVSYTDGFVNGLKIGLQLHKAIANNDVVIAAVFYLMATVITLLLTKIF